MQPKYITLLLALFLSGASLFGQSSKMRRAQELMNNLQYTDAIVLYNEILEKEDNATAKISLADSYRKINDWGNAEFWYGQVVRLPESQPIHKLYYGQSLQRNGKCDLAREWYQQYVDAVPDDLRGQYLSRACDYEEELLVKNDGIYEITHMDFNSNLDDFSPIVFGDGVVFASDRDQGSAIRRTHTWTGNPFLELFIVKRKETGAAPVCPDYTYSRAEKFSQKLNTKYHEAAVSFSSDEKTIFFTRNNLFEGKTGKSDDNIIKLKVFYAESQGDGKWAGEQSLPFNSDEYSVAHPSLSPDGTTLYFSSDMPGGFGGMDLYVSAKENGRWGPPLNLGPEVNTEGNELFPFIHVPSNRLYFASDGHIGLGGLDIYYIESKGEGAWSLPENIGAPMNTLADDFGLTVNTEGTCGYFSSDREGGAGRDDIYSFKKMSAPVEIFVFDQETGNPIADAKVINACNGKELTTNKEGRVTIDMKLDQCCDFTASMEGYDDNKKEGCTKNIDPGQPVLVKIPLSKEMVFTLEGVVFDEGNGLPADGATVTIENDCGEPLADPVVTDNSGRFSFKLSKECCYVVKAQKKNFLADMQENICTKGKTASEKMNARLYLKPYLYDGDYVIENDLPGAYKDLDTGLWIDEKTGLPATGKYGDVTIKGGKIEKATGRNQRDLATTPSDKGYRDGEALAFLLHIYYDFDQSSIREDAVEELTKVLDIMKTDKGLIVEIASHTDARGSKAYNTRLSQRRAESVVAWLEGNGIARDRLVPKGYGETKKVNNCNDYIPCSEREHQLNRRTEFKVLGCIDCDAPEQKQKYISKPNENVKVDKCNGCPF